MDAGDRRPAIRKESPMPQDLQITAVSGGPLETNAYLVVDPETLTALLIDTPPQTRDEIVRLVGELGVSVEQIVITHTHWDHIVDAAALRDALEAPLLAHPLADATLESPGSAGEELPYTIAPVTPDGHLEEGDSVSLGEHTFEVYHLPGHDPAHIVLYSAEDAVMFGGDVLFPGGHGTTEIEGADQPTMVRSIARLLELPDDVTVYPGHGVETTIGAEREWMRKLTSDLA
jgi:glyoxylase-like metal-dependent hydrolase (beta-lactamase superfamily II)